MPATRRSGCPAPAASPRNLRPRHNIAPTTSIDVVRAGAAEACILDAFGPAIIDELRAGRTLVVEDCGSPEERER